ncbi:unnamed protein product [Cercopithifilaria johnstoni]|uniref:C2H2-type domain-containing protein n=1 Tax=Cercopithifilaria johnstoni TaxID=2874296 RepID=A0A8J2LTI0_9BILA|nr:unnamed protein product [Cercopithifilaria johnstoni]
MLKCNVCGKAFEYCSLLLRHKLIHENMRPLKCHVCNRTFKESRILKRHNLTHGNVRLFECEVCGWKYKQKRNLDKHIKRHESSSEKLYSTNRRYMVSTIRSKIDNVVMMVFGNDHISLLKFRNRAKSYGDKKKNGYSEVFLDRMEAAIRSPYVYTNRSSKREVRVIKDDLMKRITLSSLGMISNYEMTDWED